MDKILTELLLAVADVLEEDDNTVLLGRIHQFLNDPAPNGCPTCKEWESEFAGVEERIEQADSTVAVIKEKFAQDVSALQNRIHKMQEDIDSIAKIASEAGFGERKAALDLIRNRAGGKDLKWYAY